MIHLTLHQLSAFIDGELAEASTELVRRHLSECGDCTLRFARLESQEECLARILVDQPGDEFFRGLHRTVAIRIGAEAGPLPSGRSAEAKRAEVKRAEPMPPERKSAATKATVAKRGKSKSAEPVAEKPSEVVAPKPAEPPVAKPAQAEPIKPVVPEPPPVVAAIEETPLRVVAPIATRSSSRAPRRRAEDREAFRRNQGAKWVAGLALLVVLASVAWIVARHGGVDSPQSEIATRDVVANAPAPAVVPPRSEVVETAPRETETPPDPRSLPNAEGSVETAIESAPAPAPATPALPPTPAPAPAPTVLTTPVSSQSAQAPSETKRAKRTPKRSGGDDANVYVIVPGREPPPREERGGGRPQATEAPENLVSRPPQNVVPVRTIITETTISPAEPPTGSAPSAPPPPAMSPPPSSPAVARAKALDEAKNASLLAARTKDPVAFDLAGSAWERAIPMLNDAPEDLAMARRELAQARFQAWADSPNESRRTAAVSAARAYLLYAPPGPERDQAWTWLARLKK